MEEWITKLYYLWSCDFFKIKKYFSLFFIIIEGQPADEESVMGGSSGALPYLFCSYNTNRANMPDRDLQVEKLQTWAAERSPRLCANRN